MQLNARLSAVLSALLLFAPPALAEPITLSLAEAEETLNGLAALSAGREVIVKEGERERVVKVQPKGWSLGLLLAITKDIDALKPAVFAYAKARDARMADLAGADGKLPAAAKAALEREEDAKRAEKQTYELARFKASELKPDTNEISPVVLSALRAVLAAE